MSQIQWELVEGWTGLIGAQGTTGLQGLTGIDGVSGVTGAQGYTGAQGEKGNTGTQGQRGLEGAQGVTGQSGLTGLRGETGYQGVTGALGATGSTGALGPTGLPGAQGPTGVTYMQGETGVRGATGLQGTPFTSEVPPPFVPDPWQTLTDPGTIHAESWETISEAVGDGVIMVSSLSGISCSYDNGTSWETILVAGVSPCQSSSVAYANGSFYAYVTDGKAVSYVWDTSGEAPVVVTSGVFGISVLTRGQDGKFSGTSPNPHTGMVEAIAFDGTSLVTASASYPPMFHSADYGASWSPVLTLPTLDCVTNGPNNCTIVSTGSSLVLSRTRAHHQKLVSTNGGASWQLVETSNSSECMAVGNGRIIAAGAQVSSSTDGGLTWSDITAPPALTVKALAFGDGLFVAVTGNDQGDAWWSDNNGNTWQDCSVAVPSTGFSRVAFLNHFFLAYGLGDLVRLKSFTVPAPVDLTRGKAGMTGQRGVKGATGIVGSTGVQGLQGPAGEAGVTGMQGPTGNKGATGPQGLTGLGGAQGPKGLTGYKGISGDTGVIGSAGAIGKQGITGARGPQGLTGGIGAQGATGRVGATGFQGLQGAMYQESAWQLQPFDTAFTNPCPDDFGAGIAYAEGVFVVVRCEQILRSTDFGVSWSNISLGALSDVVWSSVVFGNGIFLASGARGNADTGSTLCAVSADGGLSWSTPQSKVFDRTAFGTLAFGGGVFLLSGTRYAGGTYSGAAGDSFLARSTDNGVTWTQISIDPSLYWCAVTYGAGIFMASCREVRASGQVIKSIDGGITWTDLATSPVAVGLGYHAGIFFTSDLYPPYQMIFPGYTTSCMSEDAGTTWTSLHLSSVCFSEISGSLFAFGYGPGVYTSTDNGASWQTLVFEGSSSGMLCAATGDGVGLAVVGYPSVDSFIRIGSSSAPPAEGVIGHQGPQGATGTPGLQGLPGVIGGSLLQQGVQGLTGAVGTTGFQGYTGSNGITGLSGVTGMQGANGVTAPQGVEPTSTPGYPGGLGTQGATGAQGVNSAGTVTSAGPSGYPYHPSATSDLNILLCSTSSGAGSVILPTCAGNTATYIIKNLGSSTLAISATSSTVQGVAGISASATNSYYRLWSDGVSNWVITSQG